MMKTLPVLLLLLLLSCTGNRINKKDLSGVYVRSFSNEYAVGVDTLKLDEVTSGSYRITKSSSYQRTIDGKLHKDKEYHIQHWLGIINKQNNELNIQPSGKLLSVDFDKQEILLGNANYRRVAMKNGTFSLDKDYFSSLNNISPAVKKDNNIANTVTLQSSINDLYNKAKKDAGSSYLSSSEQNYIQKVWSNLLDKCSDDNPHVFLIEKWSILENKDLKTVGR